MVPSCDTNPASAAAPETGSAQDTTTKEARAKPSITITPAHIPSDLPVIRTLFLQYAQSLGIDLSFQSFEQELASLPGRYAREEDAALFLAKKNTTGDVMGIAALRALTSPSGSSHDRGGEIKRLYVCPSGRGLGIGRALAERVIQEARRVGYRAVYLDTLPSMSAARALYKKLGFAECGPYSPQKLTDPLDEGKASSGVLELVYMKLVL